MLKPPYDVIPTNSKVKLEGAITASIAKTTPISQKSARSTGESSIRSAAR